MRKFVLAAVGAATLFSGSAMAAEVQLFDRNYTPTDLQALFSGNSATLGPGFLQINPGNFREIVIEDSVSAAGAFAGFDQVRFDFSYDYLPGSFGGTDKDTFVGIHDGTSHYSIFNNETGALNVFGDLINQPCTLGIGIGGCPPTFTPSSPATVRDVNVVPGYNASAYSASILMDSSGLATLSVLGAQASPMQLDFGGPFSFFFATDESNETYRIQSMAITVTGITVSEPGALGLALVGCVLCLAGRRRRAAARLG